MKALFIIFAIAGLAITALLQTLQFWDARGENRFQGPYISFCAMLRCVERSAFEDAARTRDWRVENETTDEFGTALPQGKSSIRVYISPPLPFAKILGVKFNFGAQGCLVR